MMSQATIASELVAEERRLRALYEHVLASHNLSDGVAQLILASFQDRIAEVGKARRRLEAGVYGLCECCGSPIKEARLTAKREAYLCIECARQQTRFGPPLAAAMPKRGSAWD